MSNRTSSISVADLSAAGVRLRASEAVAVVRDVALRAASGALPGIPSIEAIRLNSDGSVAVEGPVVAGKDVIRAARLLATLLSNAAPEVSAPAMFRLILARAFATDEAAYDSLEQFAEALAPFSAPDPATALRELLSTSHIARAVLAFDEGIIDTEQPSQDAEPPAPLAEFETEEVLPAPGPVTLRPARDRRRAASTVRGLLSGPVVWRRAAWLPAAAILLLLAVGFSTRWMVPSSPARVASSLPPAAPPSAVAAAPQQTAAPESVASAPGLVAPIPVEAPKPPQLPGRGDGGPAPGAAPSNSAASASRSAASPVTPTEILSTAAFSPSFASVASAMFYHSGKGPESAIMRADTGDRGEVLRVTSVVKDRGANFHPRPSPDGQTIAFDSDRDGERGVYIAAGDGSGVRRISGSGFAAVPSWSPDGRRLAYVRAEDGHPRVWNIWTVDVASGETSRITSHRVGQPWGAAWFPDGQRIAYSHETRLIVQSLGGGGVRRFNTPVRGRLVRTPAVSPDGKRIIFQVRHDGAWILDLIDDTMRRILEDPSAEEFTWSPDGRRVAYHSRRSGKWGVWIMSPRD